MWAKLAIYKELQEFRGSPKKEKEAAHRMVFILQRLSDDETGKLLPTLGLHDRVARLLNPDQGADLADMGEWSEWIIESFFPVKYDD